MGDETKKPEHVMNFFFWQLDYCLEYQNQNSISNQVNSRETYPQQIHFMTGLVYCKNNFFTISKCAQH